MRIEEYIVREWPHYLENRVVNFAKRHLRQLGRDYMLSGDDSPLCNVWEEICAQQRGEESFYWFAYKYVIDAIQSASKKWSMPIQNWRLAMSRFILEFGDRLNGHI